MARKYAFFGIVAVLMLFLVPALPLPGEAADAPRISAEVLKALLGNSEVTVLDVRRGSDYAGSGSKIQGAVRETEKDVSWASNYEKDKILVLYCA